MQCHLIVLDTTGMTHTFYEIEKRKETKKKRKQRRQSEREKERRKKHKKQIAVVLHNNVVFVSRLRSLVTTELAPLHY